MASESGVSRIPAFRADGYLPDGVHRCTDAEAVFRFGSANRVRGRLVVRLRQWVRLGRVVGALRLLLDGSFVTAKEEPNDLDAVMLIPPNFGKLLEQGSEAAVELETMFLTRQPQELFAAEDEADWLEWVEFFCRTREADGRRKGLVEIEL